MRFSYFDTEVPSKAVKAAANKKLAPYREELTKVIEGQNSMRPEYSLVHAADGDLHTKLAELKKQFKAVKHLVVVGIGGSSLGVEAVHTGLGQEKVKLSVIDTIAPYEMDILLDTLTAYKKLEKFAICVISKSGETPETLVNASVLLSALEKSFGTTINKQIVCISDPKTELARYAKRKKMVSVTMPSSVGGRFSVGTEASLVPLALLGHDVDAFIEGLLDANTEDFEQIAADGAIEVFEYLKCGYRHYNFFAFDKRLEKVGAWYRQLFAESLGKATTSGKKPNKLGMVPTITTPVELHSIGQLYFSGFPGVFTEFIAFDDADHEHVIPKAGIAKAYGSYSNQEVAVAMYAGVVQAYQLEKLPYRSIILDEPNLTYSLGLYMALRMREVMYIAKLMEVNAFNQPNVELYKKKTKAVLGL